MGGFGSGRSGGGPVIEDGLTISIDKLRADQTIMPNMFRCASLAWSWTHTGERIADIGMVIDTQEDGGEMRLQFARTDNRTGERESVDQRIRLVTVAQRLGGRRWYAACPVTGVRCLKLYLPPGASRFAARGAWRRLGYRVQREAPYDQAIRRAFKLRRRLGDDHGAIGDPIAKPRWMRWRTFDRQRAVIERVEARVEGYLAAFLDRLRSRDPGIQL